MSSYVSDWTNIKPISPWVFDYLLDKRLTVNRILVQLSSVWSKLSRLSFHNILKHVWVGAAAESLFIESAPPRSDRLIAGETPLAPSEKETLAAFCLLIWLNSLCLWTPALKTTICSRHNSPEIHRMTHLGSFGWFLNECRRTGKQFKTETLTKM